MMTAIALLMVTVLLWIGSLIMVVPQLIRIYMNSGATGTGSPIDATTVKEAIKIINISE